MTIHFAPPPVPVSAGDMTVSAIVRQLDERAAYDPVCRAAARVIRGLEEQILSLDNEIVEAEWRALSNAVEVERMADHRYALIVANAMKRADR